MMVIMVILVMMMNVMCKTSAQVPICCVLRYRTSTRKQCEYCTSFYRAFSSWGHHRWQSRARLGIWPYSYSRGEQTSWIRNRIQVSGEGFQSWRDMDGQGATMWVFRTILSTECGKGPGSMSRPISLKDRGFEDDLSWLFLLFHIIRICLRNAQEQITNEPAEHECHSNNKPPMTCKNMGGINHQNLEVDAIGKKFTRTFIRKSGTATDQLGPPNLSASRGQ